MNMTDEVIYVRLLDEGLDVWRPVQAQKIDEHVYRISDQPYDRDDETWAFEPGSIVLCEPSQKSGQDVLIASKLFVQSKSTS